MDNNSNQRAVVPCSSHNIEEGSRQTRQPSNMQGLLRLSIEASQNDNLAERNSSQNQNHTGMDAIDPEV